MANHITDYIEKILGSKYTCGIYLPGFLDVYFKKQKFSLNHARKYPYFSVEEYGPEAALRFERGNIILKNLFTPDRLIIPVGIFEKALKNKDVVILGDWKDASEVEGHVFNQMIDVSNEIEQSGVLAPGYMFSFGVADGSAHYVTTKVNKRTVKYEHRSFGDGYVCQAMGIDGTMDINRFKSVTMFGSPSIFSSVSH